MPRSPIANFPFEDDRGITLESAGRNHIRVNVSGYRVKLPCEIGMRPDGSTGCIVYLSTISDWEIPPGAPMDGADKNAIGRYIEQKFVDLWGWVDVC